MILWAILGALMAFLIAWDWWRGQMSPPTTAAIVAVSVVAAGFLETAVVSRDRLLTTTDDAGHSVEDTADTSDRC